MKSTDRTDTSSASGFELILAGLALAVLGAGSVVLLVIGASFLYVGRYPPAVLLLSGCLVGAVIFMRTYGPYLARLERRAPAQPCEQTSAEATATAPVPPATEQARQPSATEPLPTNVIVALATGAYGLIITAGGLIWTQGQDLVFNLIAGAALLTAALGTWWLGRPGRG